MASSYIQVSAYYAMFKFMRDGATLEHAPSMRYIFHKKNIIDEAARKTLLGQRKIAKPKGSAPSGNRIQIAGITMVQQRRAKVSKLRVAGDIMKKPRQMRVFPAIPRAATGMAAVKRNAKRTVSLAGFGQMAARAKQASAFLKALSNESRLLILCLLCEGEKSVTELEDLLSLRQSAVSQQLARLRLDGLVRPRRNGKAVHYSLANDGVGLILGALHALFGKRANRARRKAARP
jgi:DNA-binding transcriptional ArsR family regulator